MAVNLKDIMITIKVNDNGEFYIQDPISKEWSKITLPKPITFDDIIKDMEKNV